MKFSKLIPKVNGDPEFVTIYQSSTSCSVIPSRTGGFYVQPYGVDPYGTYFLDSSGNLSKMISIYHDDLSTPTCGPDNRIYLCCPTISSWDWPNGGELFSYDVGSSSFSMICGSQTEVVSAPVYGVDGRHTRFISLTALLGVTKDGILWACDSDALGSGFSILKITPDGQSRRVLYYQPSDPNIIAVATGAVSPNGYDVYLGITEIDTVLEVYHASIHRLVDGSLKYVASINEAYPKPYFDNMTVTMSGQVLASCLVINDDWTSNSFLWSVSPNGEKNLVASTDNVGFKSLLSDAWGNSYLAEA